MSDFEKCMAEIIIDEEVKRILSAEPVTTAVDPTINPLSFDDLLKILEDYKQGVIERIQNEPPILNSKGQPLNRLHEGIVICHPEHEAAELMPLIFPFAEIKISKFCPVDVVSLLPKVEQMPVYFSPFLVPTLWRQ